MKADWEERQKTNPMNGIMGAATGQGGGGNPMGNFDMASFLAGSSKKDAGGGGGSSSTEGAYADAAKSGGGGSGGGGKKGKR